MPNIIFDAHCDTISKIADSNESLLKNSFHIDLERMQKNRHIQVFAAFINKKEDKLSPFLRCNQLIDCYHRQIFENHDKIQHCSSIEDILSVIKQNKVAALLSIEGGEALMGNIENLLYFYDRGVRLITLCWNYSNEIADGVEEDRGRGLTAFGKTVATRMNELGMVIDISHISPKSFWDVLETTKKPIVASHSNAYSICKHKRNLTDEQILAIIKNNGCIGINLYRDFLSDGECDISSVLKHIEYIMALGGENNIGLGSDFDGMSSLPSGFKGIENLGEILEELLKIGYSEKLVENILYGNFLRVFKENFK